MRLITMTLAGIALMGCEMEQEISGAQAYQAQCAACHGANGQGDGPAAAGLAVEPPDLTMIARRNGGTFPQDSVMSMIDGLNRNQHGGDPMPRFGDGDLGPIVMTDDGGNPMPVPAELLVLSEYLKTIQR
jgi:mono/diheme cytochrome c family protein